MKISSITVRSFGNSYGNLKAIMSVTFDRQFVVHDVKLIENRNRMLLQMPASKMEVSEEDLDKLSSTKGARIQKSKGKDVIYRDIVHPISEEFRGQLERIAVLAYEVAKKDSAAKSEEDYTRPTRIVDSKSMPDYPKELEGITVSYNVPRAKGVPMYGAV